VNDYEKAVRAGKRLYLIGEKLDRRASTFHRLFPSAAELKPNIFGKSVSATGELVAPGPFEKLMTAIKAGYLARLGIDEALLTDKDSGRFENWLKQAEADPFDLAARVKALEKIRETHSPVIVPDSLWSEALKVEYEKVESLKRAARRL